MKLGFNQKVDSPLESEVTADIVTIALGGVSRAFTFDIRVVGLDITSAGSCGFQLFGTVRTDGVTATVVGIPDKINNQEAILNATDANLVVSGNNAIVRVLGQAGQTINWAVFAVYVFI